MSAYWKIPLQALILVIGVLVFLFYTFAPSPMLFNPRHDGILRERQPAVYAALESRHAAALAGRELAARDAATAPGGAALATFKAQNDALETVRKDALAAAADASGESARDVNYIIPRFVLDNLPLGFAGVFLAAVLAAAMSSIAAELNSLATATVVDFYQRWYRKEDTDLHFLNVGRIATALWGVFAMVVATYAATLGSLIEVVNRFGSFFYGSILGVFLLAMVKRATALGAFAGLIAGMSAVAAVSFGLPRVSFLWHNVIGAVVVFSVGLLLSVGGKGEALP